MWSLINILTCHMYMFHIYKFHCHGVCHRQHVLKSRLVPSFSEMLPSFVPRLQQEKSYAPVMSIGLCVGTRRSSVMCSTGFWGSKQNSIAVWAPTKPPARNGQFAKTCLGPSTLTLACARHAAFAPAHGISQKWPRKIGPHIHSWIFLI